MQLEHPASKHACIIDRRTSLRQRVLLWKPHRVGVSPSSLEDHAAFWLLATHVMQDQILADYEQKPGIPSSRIRQKTLQVGK